MVIVLSIIPVTNLLGGTQEAWIKYGVAVGLVVMLTLLICWRKAKETTAEEVQAKKRSEEEAVPFRESVQMLFRNKYWVMTLIMGFISQIYYGISGSSVTYYAKWIFGDDNLTAILGGVGMVPTLLGFALTNIMIKRFGTTGSLKISFMIGAVANLLQVFNPTHIVWNTVWMCFSLFANIPMMCLMGVLSAMVIDYNEYKYGKKMVATSQSVGGFEKKWVQVSAHQSLAGVCHSHLMMEWQKWRHLLSDRQFIHFVYTYRMPYMFYS